MSKKYLFTIIIFLFNALLSFAIEEISLESRSLDYFSDVYYGRIEEDEKVSPLLKLFSKDGLQFKNSYINSVKAYFLYDGQIDYEHRRWQGQGLKHNFITVEPMVLVNFNDSKSKFMIDYNLVRNLSDYSNGFTQKISQLYVSHDITPNQTILLGQGLRLPSSYDGAKAIMDQEMVMKSQSGRTFGNRRSAGIRNIASYKYVDYDIGIYDSTQYMKEFGNGADFTGCIMLKPFSDSDNENSKTNFKFGAGYSNGHNNISYNMYSIFAVYDYKKFHIHGEYANSDGYNAIKESSDKADGLYSLISYELTPKLKLIGRFDNFTDDKNKSNSYTNEYTAGISYNVFKNFKVMINYVKRVNSRSTDSDMILFATRFII